MKKIKKTGFTLVELVITMGLLLILFGLFSVTLLGTIRKPVRAGVTDVLTSDLKSQQAKAMMGEGSRGIDFSTNSYTLTPDNFTVNLPDGFEFTTNMQVVFAAGTGETTDTTIFIRDTQSGEVTTLKINKYGAIY